MCVHIPFRLNPIASLAWLGKQLPCPLHVKAGGKTVKEVAVETLCPGVDTHRSPSSALFSKNGGRRGGCVLFGHKVALTRQQQLQRWRVEMCIFEWCGVLIGGLIEPSAGSRQLWNP